MKKLLLLILFFSVSVGLYSQTSIGILGSATPGMWEEDQDMTQDAENPDIWTIEMTLTDGAAKFRADDSWDINWGSLDFPTGIGEQGGPDIPVFAGDYFITFNSATGEYNFDVDSNIGIIGTATPGGWDEDTDMFQDQTDPNKYFIELDLVDGEAKFRQDDDWAVSWGSTAFPTGVGELGGDNIPVTPGAFYLVTFDISTGEYSFTSEITYESIGLIGDATPGGWDEDTDMTQDPDNGEMWSLIISLADGEVKFRANDDWADNWGSTDFPSGVGAPGGDNIPVVAGDYFVTFNSTTGDYNFQVIETYATVGIIGDATEGGWEEDTDLDQDPENEHMWSKRLILSDGEAKFRANDEWVVDWGAGDFPSGVGTQGGANIPITAGDYIIEFNSLTGAYNFNAVVEYGTVGIIGKSGPFADWEGDTGMEKDAGDFNVWSLASVVLTDFDPEDTGGSGIKFRAENDWAVNWGEVDFPAGVGTAGGPNIECVAGTYSVTFNSLSGEYLFGPVASGIDDIINPADIVVSPNPTTDFLNIDLSAVELSGALTIKVTDLSGKEVLRQEFDASDISKIDVSSLATGSYLLSIFSEGYMIGKKFNVSN